MKSSNTFSGCGPAWGYNLLPARIDDTAYDWRDGFDKNLLTWRLLREGHTPDDHPDYVMWTGFKQFEYNSRGKGLRYWRTPCGLYAKSDSVYDCHYMGIEWSPENNNPLCNCPYWDFECKRRPAIWVPGKDSTLTNQCVCIPSSKYDPARSVEAVREIQEQRAEKAMSEYLERHPTICSRHVYFDRRAKRVKLRYDVHQCLSCPKGECKMFHEPECNKKGNVFFDLKIVTANHNALDIFTADASTSVTITRGMRLYDDNKPLNICQRVARYFPGEVNSKIRSRYHRQLFFAEYHGERFDYKISNIRAESRASRDLAQDLADISEGITVIHESDAIKASKEAKKVQRSKRKNQRHDKFIAAIIKGGESAVKEYTLSKALDGGFKWIEAYEAGEAIEQHEAKVKAEREKREQAEHAATEQITLF